MRNVLGVRYGEVKIKSEIDSQYCELKPAKIADSVIYRDIMEDVCFVLANLVVYGSVLVFQVV